MFGLSKAAVTYVSAGVVTVVGVGAIAYQAWKPNQPRVARPAPAPQAQSAPPVAQAPGAISSQPIQIPAGTVLADPAGSMVQRRAPAPGPGEAPRTLEQLQQLQSGVGAQVRQTPAPAGQAASSANAQIAALGTDQLRSPAGANPGQAGGSGRAAGVPEFDVVRVESTGGAVVAGRALPNSKVVLLNKGQEIASVQTDANGNFVIVPLELPPGDHILALGVDRAGARVDSAQNVTVSVPTRGGGNTLVALAEPDKPTRILSQPAPAGAAAAPGELAGSPAVAFRSVEADEGGGFFATGSGAPAATLRLYLNDIPVATVTVGSDRQWSLRIERGMTPGGYRVRADQVDAAGNVLARAEVPFDYPERRIAAIPGVPLPPVRPADLAAVATVGGAPAAQSSSPAQPTIAATAPSAVPAQSPTATATEAVANPLNAAGGSNAVVAEIQTVTVIRGDNLWRISRKMLGRGMRYTQIYEANLAQIRDPRRIYPNQIFVVPGAQPN